MSENDGMKLIVPYSRAQANALSIAAFLSGCLSILGSALILRTSRKRSAGRDRMETFELLLCMLSAFDIIGSLCYSVGQLMLPSWTGLPLAIGNMSTCKARGFLMQFGLGSVYCNASLCIFLMLVIGRNKTNEWIQAVAEKWLVGVPIVMAIVMSVSPLVLNCYAYDGLTSCWIAPQPYDCLILDHSLTCDTCKNWITVRWIFTAFHVFFVYIIIIVSLVYITYEVRRIERLNERYIIQNANTANRYSSQRSQERPRTLKEYVSNIFAAPSESVEFVERVDYSRTKKVMRKAFLYGFAFMLMWIFSYARREFAGRKDLAEGRGFDYIFPLHLLDQIFLPLQGFLNYLIFRKSG